MFGNGILNMLNFDRNVIHVENPYTTIWKICGHGLDKNHAWFEQLDNDAVILVDFSQEYWGDRGPHGVINRAIECLSTESFPYLVLSHDPADHDPGRHVYFYPGEYHRCRSKFIWPMDHDLDTPRSWILSCMNNAPRYHRIMLWYLYSHSQLHKSSLWSMHQLGHPEAASSHSRPLPLEVQQWWNQNYQHLPLSVSGQQNKNYLHEFIYGIDQPAYVDCYVNVATEHVMTDHFYACEKLWKPIASGQLFVVAGCLGSIATLKSWGVDVFDDIIDHSYDQVTKWEDRCRKIISECERLTTLDWTKIWTATATRRQNNIENFKSGAFDPGFTKILQLKLDTYK